MTRRLQADAVIIGGGIVGGSAALFMRRAGLSVILLDKGFAVRRQAASIMAACAGRAAPRNNCRLHNGRMNCGRACRNSSASTANMSAAAI